MTSDAPVPPPQGIFRGARNNHGWPALMQALQHSHERIAKVLLEKGADFNLQAKIWHADAQEHSIMTILMYASFEGLEAVVEILLKKGANVHFKTSDGMTALSLAKTKRIAQMLKVAGAR